MGVWCWLMNRGWGTWEPWIFEERGGGGRSELRQCPGPGSATLHLPSPHQGQVVVAAAFTVAVIDLARVGAAGSVAVWASGLPMA